MFRKNSLNEIFLELNIAISRKKSMQCRKLQCSIEKNDRKCKVNKNPEN